MSEIILVGDRVLIAPEEGERQTKSGLVLPATVADQDKVRGGRVVRVGPGYVIPNPEFSEGEPWAAAKTAVRYLPLQAQPGDYAFYVKKESVEITYEEKTFQIVPHGAILALVRPDPEDVLDQIGGIEDLDELLGG